MSQGTLHLNALPKRTRSRVLHARSQNLHDRLETLFDTPIDLWITRNKRSFVRVSSPPTPAPLRLRLHTYFLDAPESVQDALKMLCLCTHEPTIRHARNVLHQFIDEAHTRAHAPRPIKIKHQGHTHNLLTLYTQTLHTLSEKDPKLSITWGQRRNQTTRRRSIRLGSYDFQRQLIRIHPALDAPTTPAWALRFVIFHEILHHFIPPVSTPTRTLQHPPAFRKREAQHPDYTRFQHWLDANLSTLLRANNTLK